MPRIKNVIQSFAFVLVISAVFQFALGAEEDVGTEAPIDMTKVRAFTIDPDDGTEIMLAMPSYEKCVRRLHNTLSIGEYTFWVSQKDSTQVMVDPDTHERFNKTYTWLQARNECRKKCMDLVALDDPLKNQYFSAALEFTGVTTGVWTSGKRCLFQECEKVHEPVHLNGWYWSSTGTALHPANVTEQGWSENPWGAHGIMDMPQPDNAEKSRDDTVIEACLAVKTAPMTHRRAWHDVACHRKLGAACEEQPELVKFVEQSHGGRPLPSMH